MSEEIEKEIEEINYNSGQSIYKSSNIISITNTKKLTKDDWLTIEKRALSYSNFEKCVQICLINLGLCDDVLNIDKQNTVIGNNFYMKIRPLLEKHKYVIGKQEYIDDSIIKKKGFSKSKHQNQNKGMSANEIRFESTIKTLEQLIINLLDKFSLDVLTYENGLKSIFLEGRGITLMYCAWFVLRPQFKQSNKLKNIYEIIVGIQKFLKSTIDYRGRSMINQTETINISDIMQSDLSRWLNKLIEIYPIDGYTLYNIAPKLLFFGDFDDACPNKGVLPRISQKNLMHIIQSNDIYLIRYCAMINSGKTTFAATALPSFVKKYRLAHHGSSLKALVCCNFKNVCFDMASIAYANNIKFGYACMIEDYEKKTSILKITPSNICSDESDMLLIIAGLDATLKILQDDNDRMNNLKKEGFDINGIHSNYILFNDELTADSDCYTSKVLRKNIEILHLLPDKTILSSATLPDLNNLTDFLTIHKNRFPNIDDKIFTVISNEIQSSCDIFTYDGEPVVPHLLCKTSDQLLLVIKKINDIPFLGRLYTPLIVKKLWENLKMIDGIPDIRTIFADSNNMKPDCVRQMAIKMLEILAETNDNELITNICKINNDDDDKYNFNQIRFDYLCSDDAHKLAGGITLIATTEPYQFANKYFSDYLKQINLNINTSVKKILHSYLSEVELIKTNIDVLHKKIKREDLLVEKLNVLENNVPKIQFPKYAQINTQQHMIKYAQKYKSYIDRSNIRDEFVLELHPTNLDISEDLLLMLWCGIAIYDPDNSQIDPHYTTHVHELMSLGQLAYVISNKKIMYGSNYPIRNVIVYTDLPLYHSMNSLNQLFGRAGRVGLAFRASIFIDDGLAKRIYDFIHYNIINDLDCETININNMFKRINKESIDKADQAQQKLLYQKHVDEQRNIQHKKDIEFKYMLNQMALIKKEKEELEELEMLAKKEKEELEKKKKEQFDNEGYKIVNTKKINIKYPVGNNYNGNSYQSNSNSYQSNNNSRPVLRSSIQTKPK